MKYIECSEECTDLYMGELNDPFIRAWHMRASSSGQDSAVHLHLKDKGLSFEDNNVHILAREDRWFERGVKEANSRLGPASQVVSSHILFMLPSVLRCARSASTSLALNRPLAHFRPHMDPDPSRPVERSIRTKLTNAIKLDHLEVHNESHMHAVPPGSESHFRVLVVSSQFDGLPLIKRHRMVNEALKEELSSCVHALAIQAKTPEQWGSNPTLAKSPPCMGGSRGDHTVEEKLKAGRE